jgi:hypothetical protein
MKTAYQYEFHAKVDLPNAESTLALARLATAGIFGGARVQLDSHILTNWDQRTCEIDASTAVGQTINLIFTVFLQKEFGQTNFTVRRLAEESTGESDES